MHSYSPLSDNLACEILKIPSTSCKVNYILDYFVTTYLIFVLKKTLKKPNSHPEAPNVDIQPMDTLP